jgi:hypothetical protein
MWSLYFGGLDPRYRESFLRWLIRYVTGLRASVNVTAAANRRSYAFADFKTPLEMLYALAAFDAATAWLAARGVQVRARPVLRGTKRGRGAEREALSPRVATTCWCWSADDVPRAASCLKEELAHLLTVRVGFRAGDACVAADAVVNHAAAGAPTVVEGLRAAMVLLHYPECIAPWAAAALGMPTAAMNRPILVEVARRLRCAGCLREGHAMTVAVRDALERGDAAAETLRTVLWWALRCPRVTGSADAVVGIAERELAEWRRRRRRPAS